jgi:hypothetical protein
MVVSTEREPIDKDLEERAEEATPLVIERKEVVTPIPTQFKAQVNDDSGKPLIQTPPLAVTTVAVPADSGKLAGLAKGSIDESLTWFARFWQRIIKKAIHFGWKIVGQS